MSTYMLESSSGATRHESCLKKGEKAKTYVLDTNVLLHDPHCLFKFDDNNLVIPIATLEELDAIKWSNPVNEDGMLAAFIVC